MLKLHSLYFELESLMFVIIVIVSIVGIQTKIAHRKNPAITLIYRLPRVLINRDNQCGSRNFYLNLILLKVFFQAFCDLCK